MIMLFLSGLTAIPVQAELKWLSENFPFEGSIRNKFRELYTAVLQTKKNAPALFYGFDWLAFAHFILAILFIGPLRDPVKNTWVIEFGIIACGLVIPYALIAGYLRGIPVWWRLIDCSFGVIGLVPLLIVRQKIRQFHSGKEISNGQYLPDYSIL